MYLRIAATSEEVRAQHKPFHSLALIRCPPTKYSPAGPVLVVPVYGEKEAGKVLDLAVEQKIVLRSPSSLVYHRLTTSPLILGSAT